MQTAETTDKNPSSLQAQDIGEKGGFIELVGLTKKFDTPSGAFYALKNVSLRIGKGRKIALVGKSGSGKSTLLNMITGIDRPSSGLVRIGEVPVHALSETELALWRGENVGVVFQFFQLLPTLTVLENVMLPMEFTNHGSAILRRERAFALLETVGIVEQADKLPSALSGGQQQRAAIARALANDPPLIVADEPTGNLDSNTAEDVFRLFDSLVNAGKTVLVVTHEKEITRYFESVVRIVDGEIVEIDGDPAFSRLVSSRRASSIVEGANYESAV